MISTILLLPHADTRERLLAPGSIGAIRSPSTGQVWFGPLVADDDGRPCVWIGALHVLNAPALGGYLVLARDGAVVPEGVDRLCRVMQWDRGVMETRLGGLLAGERGSISWRTPGTIVLLDADGKEVSDV